MKDLTLFPQLNIAEIKLSYKNRVPASERIKITSSKDAYTIIMQNWDDSNLDFFEEFKVLLLNRSNSVLGILPLSRGGISGTVTDIRIILAAALKANASGLIVAHNHPSGNLNPSESDSRITQKIKQAGEIMDIQLLDHLIIAAEEYYSFADSGML
jgi:DNA repair protein RadC